MSFVPSSFRYTHGNSDLIYGRGCISDIERTLTTHGLDRVLVVCGANVGSNDDLMDRVKSAIGTKLISVFDGTTPSKSVESVYGGIATLNETESDVIVGVGGGSSLDTARQISVFARDGRSLEELRAELATVGHIQPPDDDAKVPVIVIPTTLPGADMSSGGSIEVASAEASPTGSPVRIRGRVSPIAMFYDPDLYETTPPDVLAGSAMNGFNKGIETLYAANATPITDSTAMHGLGLLEDGLRRLDDETGLEKAVVGYILAQFERRTSILHAFGSGLSNHCPIQQGIAHAVVTPAVLRYLFEQVDARRELIAGGLGLDTTAMGSDEIADSIISNYKDLCSILGLPTRIQSFGSVDRADLPSIAEYILDDDRINRAPVGFDPTVSEIEDVLREVW